MAPAPEAAGNSARRRRAAGVAGHTGDEASARAVLQDHAPEVRTSALSALARMGALRGEDLISAMADPAAQVRQRACDLAGRHQLVSLARPLIGLLADEVAPVAEAACYALGELGGMSLGGTGYGESAVAALDAVARTHREPLCREAAVAALGALGCTAGLPAVLAALADKPAIRRRAVVALAAFDGDQPEAALIRAASDPDWQVRQAAEDLLGHRPRPK